MYSDVLLLAGTNDIPVVAETRRVSLLIILALLACTVVPIAFANASVSCMLARESYPPPSASSTLWSLCTVAHLTEY